MACNTQQELLCIHYPAMYTVALLISLTMSFHYLYCNSFCGAVDWAWGLVLLSFWDGSLEKPGWMVSVGWSWLPRPEMEVVDMNSPSSHQHAMDMLNGRMFGQHAMRSGLHPQPYDNQPNRINSSVYIENYCPHSWFGRAKGKVTWHWSSVWTAQSDGGEERERRKGKRFTRRQSRG